MRLYKKFLLVVGLTLIALFLFFFIKQNYYVVCRQNPCDIRETFELRDYSLFTTVLSSPDEAAKFAKVVISNVYDEPSFYHGPYFIYEENGLYYILALGIFHNEAAIVLQKIMEQYYI